MKKWESDCMVVYDIGKTPKQVSNLTSRQLYSWFEYLEDLYARLCYLEGYIDNQILDTIDSDFENIRIEAQDRYDKYGAECDRRIEQKLGCDLSKYGCGMLLQINYELLERLP